MSTEFTVPEVFVSPVIPIRDVVVFPHTVLPIFIGRAKSLKAVEAAMQGDQTLLLIPQRDLPVSYTHLTLPTILRV